MSNLRFSKVFTIFILLLVTVIISGCAKEQDLQVKEVDLSKKEHELQEKKYDLPDGLYAVMKTTKGEIILSLEYEKTPLTVINFVGLAEGKMNTSAKEGPYYDGLKFHRVIDNFMIQGGDPQGTGAGGPGYKFADEIDNSLQFNGPGVFAMANAGPGTNGSQFFITHVETPWLQGKHTIFGHVVSGQDIVDNIKQGDSIEKVSIIRNGAAAEAFRADQDSFNKIKGN